MVVFEVPGLRLRLRGFIPVKFRYLDINELLLLLLGDQRLSELICPYLSLLSFLL